MYERNVLFGRITIQSKNYDRFGIVEMQILTIS